MKYLKLILLTILFQLIGNFLFSQTNRIDFLNAENEATFFHIYKKDFVKSYDLYKKLFEINPVYVSKSIKLFLYIESSFKNNDNDLVIKIYQKRLELGLDTTLYIDKNYPNLIDLREAFFSLKNSKTWMNKIDKKQGKKRNESQKPNNLELNSAINEISYLIGFDQGVRNALHVKDFFLNDSCKDKLDNLLNDKLVERDSLNFKELIQILRKLNSLTDKIEIINKAFIIMVHDFKKCKIGKTIDSSDFFYIQNVLYQGLIENDLNNETYANFIDMSLTTSRNSGCQSKQKYGSNIYFLSRKDTISNLFPIDDIINIDKIRAEIGLPSLYEASIEYRFKLPEAYIIPEKYLIK